MEVAERGGRTGRLHGQYSTPAERAKSSRQTDDKLPSIGYLLTRHKGKRPAERCQHHAPIAWAVAVIRWGRDASSDACCASARRCTACGHKGATLQHPGWAGAERRLHTISRRLLKLLPIKPVCRRNTGDRSDVPYRPVHRPSPALSAQGAFGAKPRRPLARLSNRSGRRPHRSASRAAAIDKDFVIVAHFSFSASHYTAGAASPLLRRALWGMSGGRRIHRVTLRWSAPGNSGRQSYRWQQ